MLHAEVPARAIVLGRAADRLARRAGAALVRGDQVNLEGAHHFCATKIYIKTKPKQQLDIDGHTLGKTPAKLKVEPKALRV